MKRYKEHLIVAFCEYRLMAMLQLAYIFSFSNSLFVCILYPVFDHMHYCMCFIFCGYAVSDGEYI